MCGCVVVTSEELNSADTIITVIDPVNVEVL
jgi:hypothetical protein